MNNLIRRGLTALAAAAIVVSVPSAPRAVESVPALNKSITYILPQWVGFASAPASEVANQVQQLRSRLGPEGRLVRLGFTLYVSIELSPVDPGDLTAVRANLASTFEQVDHAIEAGEANGIPIGLSFVTALRARTDPLQEQAQLADRRTMQWHSDHSLAAGWATLSRYARQQEAIREAYLRELGRFLARRMLEHPDVVVAASGDGEVELSYEKSLYGNGQNPPWLADYSPFAVAEFRDWLRGTGLYAAGQPFSGEAYRNSARYNADPSLATLNADFGTSFQTWALRFEDWSLSDSPTADPRAIPASTYNQPGWTPVVSNEAGFDPPCRPGAPCAGPWRDVWNEFRQMMVYRYNLNFAKWMTTSPDPGSGATVPPERWFTDQIVADYLFGNVAPNYDLRLDTSASPHWTADVRPYGSLGITSFNQFNTATGTMHRTLAAVAPVIAQRGVRWGIFEWNPSIPAHPSIDVYREENALVVQYRPSVLVPFYWQSTHAELRVEGTPFETALQELIVTLNAPPLTLSRSSLVTAATSTGLYRTPLQLVRVSGVAGETPAWTISSSSDLFDVAVTADGRGFTVAPKAQPNSPGQQTGTVVITPSDAGYSAATLTVTLNVSPAGSTAPPIGAFDTPLQGQTVAGEVGVTGWSVDDIGVVGVDIYRDPISPESPASLVYLGAATLVPGARPDVQTSFSSRPLAEQAGWGYMLLTNMLPNQGNGSFVLHAIARDVEGFTVLLGSRSITAGNSAADRPPFGTIDTPGQGETVSGTIVNFGWALSPNLIPEDGSTIGVYIDNVFVGRPTYNQVRSDIATLFPGYPNTSSGRGAVGFFQIDTRQYANGVHTIAWVVTDSAGRSQGIGSRYFTIANP